MKPPRNVCGCGLPVADHNKPTRAAARAVARMPVDGNYRAAYEVAWQAVHAVQPRTRPYDTSEAAYAAMACAYRHPQDSGVVVRLIRCSGSDVESIEISEDPADGSLMAVRRFNGYLAEVLAPPILGQPYVGDLKSHGYTKVYDWSSR